MKRDLKGMGTNRQNADSAQKSAQPTREQPPQADINNFNDAIEHYGGKSDAELMNELINFRKQGVIDDGKLAEAAAQLAPMLNAQQRKRLESVLGTLKKT